MQTHRFVTSAVAAATLAATAVMATSTAVAADPADCSAFGTEVTQLVRPDSGGDLLSRWDSEIRGAKERYGFTEDRGVVVEVADEPGTGLVPVWRLLRAGDFVWATEGADADAFVAEGYTPQFVEFYAATDPQSCLGEVTRLERDGTHRVATASEVGDLEADGWTLDGASFYVVTPQDTAAIPPPPSDAEDTTFSIAVIPDTQHETRQLTGDRFSGRVDWLVEHQEELDLRYTVQVGDLTNWGNVEPAQFEKASEEIEPLEAVMPWSVAAGNHDTAAVCAGGKACPGASARTTVRDVSMFNRYFPPTRFPSLEGTYEQDASENSYATFAAGGKDWLVLTLELWARPEVVAWANEVVASHPDHNVIINTHAYLEGNGSIGGSNGGYGSTSPRYLFDTLVSQHPNIVMVLSGHTGVAAARTDTGEAGNRILSLLQTFHSSTNPVRLVEIDTAEGTVTSRVYAPETDRSWPEYATSTTGMDFR